MILSLTGIIVLIFQDQTKLEGTRSLYLIQKIIDRIESLEAKLHFSEISSRFITKMTSLSSVSSERGVIQTVVQRLQGGILYFKNLSASRGHVILDTTLYLLKIKA